MVPVDGKDDRFYIVSNAASRNPNKMLYIGNLGWPMISTWAFKDDTQAEWIFHPAPPSPKECPLTVGYIFLIVGMLCGVVFAFGGAFFYYCPAVAQWVHVAKHTLRRHCVPPNVQDELAYPAPFPQVSKFFRPPSFACSL